MDFGFLDVLFFADVRLQNIIYKSEDKHKDEAHVTTAVASCSASASSESASSSSKPKVASAAAKKASVAEATASSGRLLHWNRMSWQHMNIMVAYSTSWWHCQFGSVCASVSCVF